MNVITKKDVINAMELIEKYHAQERKKLSDLSAKFDTRSIDTLNIRTQTINILKSCSINTIGELLELNRNDLKRCRNAGTKTIDDVNNALKEMGIETTPFTYFEY